MRHHTGLVPLAMFVILAFASSMAAEPSARASIKAALQRISDEWADGAVDTVADVIIATVKAHEVSLEGTTLADICHGIQHAPLGDACVILNCYHELRRETLRLRVAHVIDEYLTLGAATAEQKEPVAARSVGLMDEGRTLLLKQYPDYAQTIQEAYTRGLEGLELIRDSPFDRRLLKPFSFLALIEVRRRMDRELAELKELDFAEMPEDGVRFKIYCYFGSIVSSIGNVTMGKRMKKSKEFRKKVDELSRRISEVLQAEDELRAVERKARRQNLLMQLKAQE